MIIRPAVYHDFDEIQRIYAYARAFMAQHGNPTQWGSCYPPDDMILSDIISDQLYVLTGQDVPAAVFYFHIGPDPTYEKIEEGTWISDEPYGTIHRIASDGTIHGVLALAVSFCESQIPHLRIDTHPDNLIMQRQIEKCGFVRTGIIYAEDGSPRYAYEKL